MSYEDFFEVGSLNTLSSKIDTFFGNFSDALDLKEGFVNKLF